MFTSWALVILSIAVTFNAVPSPINGDVASLKSRSLDSVLNHDQTLAKRDIVGDICGTNQGGKIASDTRNAETWQKYNIDQWILDNLGPLRKAFWQGADGTVYHNIQQAVLHLAGNEGAEECDEISNPNCGGTGLDFNLCTQHPEAHFVFFAITHFANWLNKLQMTFTYTTISTGLSTSTLVEQFFTPQVNPSSLIEPVGFINGFASAFAKLSFLGPLVGVGSFISAGATVISGVLTQKGLTKPDPLVQWGDVQSAIGKLYTSVTVALDEYFNSTLKSFKLDPITNPIGVNDYFSDRTQIPQVFKGGSFASNVQVGSLNQGVLGAIAAPAINSLWVEDKVMIFKITDKAYANGPKGSACSYFPKQTVCRDDGTTAYIFARWVLSPISGLHGGNSYPPILSVKNWTPWGATDQGKSPTGVDNVDHLTEWALSLSNILDSAIQTQDQHGYLYKYQNSDTLDQLTQDPTDITEAKLSSWAIPICDVDEVLKAQGKTFLKPGAPRGEMISALAEGGLCTCLLADKWPKEQYGDEGRANPRCDNHWG